MYSLFLCIFGTSSEGVETEKKFCRKWKLLISIQNKSKQWFSNLCEQCTHTSCEWNETKETFKYTGTNFEVARRNVNFKLSAYHSEKKEYT